MDSDRQVITKISDVQKGHFERYKFAMQRVSGKILDAACGVGYGTFMLNEVGKAVGIDVEPEAIAHAETYFPGPKYYVADVRKPWGKFDWVVSFETIEHVENPEQALEAFRHSNNLIISSPNQTAYPFDPKQYRGSKYPHLRHYTEAQFEDLLNSTGWEVVEKWGQPNKCSKVKRLHGKFMVWICK